MSSRSTALQGLANATGGDQGCSKPAVQGRVRRCNSFAPWAERQTPISWLPEAARMTRRPAWHTETSVDNSAGQASVGPVARRALGRTARQSVSATPRWGPQRPSLTSASPLPPPRIDRDRGPTEGAEPWAVIMYPCQTGSLMPLTVLDFDGVAIQPCFRSHRGFGHKHVPPFFCVGPLVAVTFCASVPEDECAMSESAEIDSSMWLCKNCMSRRCAEHEASAWGFFATLAPCVLWGRCFRVRAIGPFPEQLLAMVVALLCARPKPFEVGRPNGAR